MARRIVADGQGKSAETRRLAVEKASVYEAIEGWVSGGRDEVERTVRAAQIALFGDGEADDIRRRRSDGVDHRLAVVGRDENLLHRADQAQLRARRAARADCMEADRRTQLRRDVARAERYADAAPSTVARGNGSDGEE